MILCKKRLLRKTYEPSIDVRPHSESGGGALKGRLIARRDVLCLLKYSRSFASEYRRRLGYRGVMHCAEGIGFC